MVICLDLYYDGQGMMVVTFKVMVEYIKLPPEHDPHKVFHNTCFNKIPDVFNTTKTKNTICRKASTKISEKSPQMHSFSVNTCLSLISRDCFIAPCLGNFNVFHLLISEHRNEPCPPVTSNV